MRISAPGRILFFSHREQIPEFAGLASVFREHSNACSILLTLGSEEAELGRQSGAFDEVIDLLPGIDCLENAAAQLGQSLAYLKRIEQRLGVRFINKDLLADRYFRGQPTPELDLEDMPVHWSLPKVYRFMAHIAERVESILDDFQPRLVYLETNSAPYRMAWRLATARGIKAGSFMSARLWKDRIYFEDSLGLEWKALQRKIQANDQPVPDEGSLAAAYDTLSALKRTDSQPWYMSTTFGMGGPPLSDKVRPGRVSAHLYEWLKTDRYAFKTNPRRLPREQLSPLARFRRLRAGARSTRFLGKVTKALDVVPLDRFALYLLHVQPELTVEEMAFHYQDQVATIRSLMAMLPPDLPLVVKEHKPMVGRRPSAFYAELAHLPGVVLASSAVSSRAMLKGGAQILFTLTGTSAIEAVANGVRAVMLGDVFINSFPGVYHPSSLVELEARLTEWESLPTPRERDVIQALARMHELSIPSAWIPQSDLGAVPVASMVPMLLEAIRASDV